MSGFKAFLLRGNLVELAVAFIMGVAFSSVVESFTRLLTDTIAKVFGAKEVGSIIVGGIDIAPFLNAVVGFGLLAVVVYFAIVVPATKARERFAPTEDTPTELDLLTDIRDALTKK
ncbi:MAG: MscL family protein [Micrococcales bacterium]|nr:MscL family protein [Micrococcales bacterium]